MNRNIFLNNLLKNFSSLVLNQSSCSCREIHTRNESVLRQVKDDVASYKVRHFHVSSLLQKTEDRHNMSRSLPAPDEGVPGEKSVDIDSLIQSRESMFPDETTPTKIFNGMPFKEVPIVLINVSKNNTHLLLTDYKGVKKYYRTCGMEGFKNCRKGTNIAAQATAVTFAQIIKNKGFKTVRVKVSGLGPGRMSSIKGLQMTGIDIISVTDATKVSYNPPRPRKQRRL